MKRKSTHHPRLNLAQLRICGVKEMRELDLGAEQEYGLRPGILMENAGRGAVDAILEYDPRAGIDSEIIVFAGKGNNAGDAFVVARHLHCLSRRVRVFHLLEATKYQGPTQENFESLVKMKCKMLHLTSADELVSFLNSSTRKLIAVDGLIGIGLKGALNGLIFDVVEILNQRVPTIISLDIPTGVCSDTGAVLGTSILATLTCSFGFPKLGHFFAPGAVRRGILVNVDISLPKSFKKVARQWLLGALPISKLLHQRDRYGHKNNFGHTFLIGGSPGRVGAIAMSTKACHRVGTGLVTASTWGDTEVALRERLWDETMMIPLNLEGRDLEFYLEQLAGFSSIVVGPGLGTRPDARRLLEILFSSYRGPLVLDADAINIVAEHRLHDHLARRGAPNIITPHPGEMARLLNIPKEKVVGELIASIQEAADRTQSVVVLKGAASLITSPGEKVYLNHYPNDGMATGGSGDVLAGMVGGLVGQKIEALAATQLAVTLHSLAGALAAKSLGHRSMTASDITGNIGHAFQELKDITQNDDFRAEDHGILRLH